MKLLKFFVLGVMLLVGHSAVNTTVFADADSEASITIKSKFRIVLSGRDILIRKKFAADATVADLKAEIEHMNGWKKGRVLELVGHAVDSVPLSRYKWSKEKVVRVIIEPAK